MAATTFFTAAKRLNWRAVGDSPFFENCSAFVAEQRDESMDMYQLFDDLLAHRTQKSLPELRTFVSKKESQVALSLIQSKWNSYLRHIGAVE